MTKIVKHSRKLYKQICKTVISLRRQEYFHGMKRILQILEEYQQLLTMILSDAAWIKEMDICAEEVVTVLQNLVAAQQNGDYILLADLMEIQVIPFLQQISAVGEDEPQWDFQHFMENFRWLQRENPQLAQELFGKDITEADAMETEWSRRREKMIEMGVVPEYSEDGNIIMSFEDMQGRFYFHTNKDVVQESQMLAESWFSGNKFDYALYGLGLGHHIGALQDLQPQIHIHVYEGNMDVVFMALCFSDMHTWHSKRTHVHIDKNLQEISTKIKNMGNLEEMEVIIHYPSMRALQNASLQNILRDYFMQYASMKMENPLLRGNFFLNEKHTAPSVWELQEEFSGRDVYVVAAGPSLDNNVEGLRNIPEDARILATGTVLKKLLNLGICPHYVIIIDTNENCFRQVEGICDCGVPLLYMATVNSRIVEEYQAEKYVIYQQGLDITEQAAADRGVKTMQTGGSVSTTALDMLLQFGAGRIIYLGLDLAFSGNVSHCSDTADRHVPGKENICEVEDIYGGKVLCGRNLNAYRKWIERRLEQGCGSTEVIDATEGGAKIRGMINKKLQDV